jgi:hypothetical protein
MRGERLCVAGTLPAARGSTDTPWSRRHGFEACRRGLSGHPTSDGNSTGGGIIGAQGCRTRAAERGNPRAERRITEGLGAAKRHKGRKRRTGMGGASDVCADAKPMQNTASFFASFVPFRGKNSRVFAEGPVYETLRDIRRPMTLSSSVQSESEFRWSSVVCLWDGWRATG